MEEKLEKEQDPGQALGEALVKGFSLDGFWRNGYDLQDSEVVAELMTIMMDFGCYEQFKKSFMTDLLRADWGYFTLHITVIDDPDKPGYKRNLSGVRKETHIRKIWNVQGFILKVTEEGGAVNEIELNTDRITRLEQSGYRKSRYSQFRWMKDHPELEHMTKSYLK